MVNQLYDKGAFLWSLTEYEIGSIMVMNGPGYGNAECSSDGGQTYPQTADTSAQSAGYTTMYVVLLCRLHHFVWYLTIGIRFPDPIDVTTLIQLWVRTFCPPFYLACSNTFDRKHHLYTDYVCSDIVSLSKPKEEVLSTFTHLRGTADRKTQEFTRK